MMMDTISALFGLPLLQDNWPRLWSGLLITFEVVITSCSIGFFLAYPICLARMSKNTLLSSAALGYVTLFRGTPLLCQLYLVYYGAGQLHPFLDQIGLWTIFREAYFCCLLAFTMNTAAYQSEIFRGALSAVPKGQIEAARALGLSRTAITRHVIFPQALLVAIRPLGNEVIGIIKASALSAIVTLPDLMGATRTIYSHTFDFQIYLYCALIYLALTETIRRVLLLIEARYSRHLTVHSSTLVAATKPRWGRTAQATPQTP